MIKSAGLITSKTIGINLWFAPQISEHWPYSSPGRKENILNWLRRPGKASTLIPIEGIVHEWITSAAETNKRIWVLKGMTVRLSTSRRRKSSFLISADGIMYASNSILGKSEYSYDQYHWWPIVLIVIAGVFTSSSRYNARNEGRAMKTKINAGMIVQINSIICPSYSFTFVNLFKIIVTRMYEIKAVMI